MEKAKVFISCGQRDNSDELKIARQIFDLLKQKGYDPFLAKQVQSTGALTEEIFRNLADCEYFLFIDFKRDVIRNSLWSKKFRGSLFSHQELAIASFQEMECLTFREKGIALEGVQSFILSNPHEFSSVDQLLKQIDEEVSIKWNSNWKKQLKVLLADPLYQDAFEVNSQSNSRWYHISVKNRHKAKHATNCFAFIEHIECGGEKRRFLNVQAYWAGCPHPSLAILPGDSREVDAFFCYRNGVDNKIYFNTHTTSGHYVPIPIERPGCHHLRFRIVSDNFPPASATFELNFTGDLDHITFDLAKI